MTEDGERPRKVRRLASSKPKLGRMVTVCVGTGEEAREFHVHDEILKRHSDFFKAALAGDRWQEGVERKVSLPEDKPEVFEGFQCFIYSGLSFVEGEAHTRTSKPGRTVDGEYAVIVEAWKLADKLQSCSYKDASTDSLALKMAAEIGVPLSMQAGLAEGTSMSAGLVRLLLDVAVRQWDVEDFAQLDLDQTPKAFVQKLLVGLAEKKNRRDADRLWMKGDCHYHDHGEEKPCYKTMFTY
ncbi:hypothetical protein LTR17_024046 [Elasticomyces elasticus]|nr:hypothetical protein LTR17_024046 [Elasticomyces elasticus]